MLLELRAIGISLQTTITTMAHNLGMQVIAEGIETSMHLPFLKVMGCELGQGFLFSQPVDEISAENGFTWREKAIFRESRPILPQANDNFPKCPEKSKL